LRGNHEYFDGTAFKFVNCAKVVFKYQTIAPCFYKKARPCFFPSLDSLDIVILSYLFTHAGKCHEDHVGRPGVHLRDNGFHKLPFVLPGCVLPASPFRDQAKEMGVIHAGMRCAGAAFYIPEIQGGAIPFSTGNGAV
jgi:hypothetical protein